MNGFQIDESVLSGPAFAGLSARAQALLMRASFYCQAHGLAVLVGASLGVIGGSRSTARELVAAGLWATVGGDNFTGSINLRRVQACNRARRYRERHRGEASRSSVTESVTNSVTNITLQRDELRDDQRYALEKSPENLANSQDFSRAPAPALSLISSSLSGSSNSSPLLALSSGSGSEISDAGARVASPVPKPKREPKPKALTWRRVPESWQPSPEHRQIARDLRIPFDLELAKFRDHEFTVPKRDPDATFRNWIRNAKPSPALPPPPTNGHKFATVAEIDR